MGARACTRDSAAAPPGRDKPRRPCDKASPGFRPRRTAFGRAHSARVTPRAPRARKRRSFPPAGSSGAARGVPVTVARPQRICTVFRFLSQYPDTLIYAGRAAVKPGPQQERGLQSWLRALRKRRTAFCVASAAAKRGLAFQSPAGGNGEGNIYCCKTAFSWSFNSAEQ